MRHVDRPEPNSSPERAMDLLLEKIRLVFGEQDWSTWEWSAREYGTREPRVIIPFFWHDGVWTRLTCPLTGSQPRGSHPR
ncbi:MAG: hypothetical protein ACXU86_16455 [Archangium sp.]